MGDILANGMVIIALLLAALALMVAIVRGMENGRDRFVVRASVGLAGYFAINFLMNMIAGVVIAMSKLVGPPMDAQVFFPRQLRQFIVVQTPSWLRFADAGLVLVYGLVSAFVFWNLVQVAMRVHAREFFEEGTLRRFRLVASGLVVGGLACEIIEIGIRTALWSGWTQPASDASSVDVASTSSQEILFEPSTYWGNFVTAAQPGAWVVPGLLILLLLVFLQQGHELQEEVDTLV